MEALQGILKIKIGLLIAMFFLQILNIYFDASSYKCWGFFFLEISIYLVLKLNNSYLSDLVLTLEIEFVWQNNWLLFGLLYLQVKHFWFSAVTMSSISLMLIQNENSYLQVNIS